MSLQGDLQHLARDTTLHAYSFDGDILDMLDSFGVAAGPLDGRVLAYAQTLDSTIKSVPAAWDYLLNTLGQASLNLQFAGASTLDSRITFTRASTVATRVNSAGLIETLTTNQPRFDYDPVTLAPRGLLIEEARTNNEKNGIADTVGNGTASTDGTLGPDGVAASKFTADSVTTAHFVYKASYTPAITTAYAVSVYLKAGTSSVLQVTTSGNFNSGFAALNVDLIAGTFALVGTGGSGGFLTSVGGGWYRAGFVVTTTAAAVGAAIMVCLANNLADNRLPNVVTNGTQTFYHACRQFESVGATGAAPFPTSYIPTTTAAVTRAADVASMTGTNFSSWFNPTEGTFVVSGDAASTVSKSNRRLISVGTGGTFEIMLGLGSLGQLKCGESFSSTTATNAAGLVSKLSASYGVSPASFVCNGGTVSNTPADVLGGTPVQMQIGAIGSSYLGGHIQRITYFNKRLPDATLKAMST